MKKSSLPKSTEVLAFLKANSADISHAETVKPRGKKLNLKDQAYKGKFSEGFLSRVLKVWGEAVT